MIHPVGDPVAQRIAQMGMQVLAGRPLDRHQARELTQLDGDALYDLFYWANRIRIAFVGRSVKFCSIVTGKVGACSEDCGYCAQSKHYHTHVTPGKMTVLQMQEAAAEATTNGASSFGVVNSGRGPTDAELDWMAPFFQQTAEQGRIRPCATLGELTEAQAHRLRDMGVERINHNLETSRRFFPNVVTTHDYDDRRRTIEVAKQAGLSICSGGIFGLGETWEDRLDVAFELRELGADVVPINFLYAIEGTPMHQTAALLSPTEALQIIAVYRFVLPDREIKAAGGREKILRDMQSWIFFAGASSFLIGNYLTTFGRSPRDDHQMLRDLNLSYATYDELEHVAEPTSASMYGPGHASPAHEALMSRRDGSLLALPVLQ